MNDNRVKEALQTFKAAEPVAEGWLARPVSYRAKVFKSGNSLALRLPAALGLEAGMEMELTQLGGGGYSLIPAAPPKRGIDVSGFWAKAPGAVPPPREDFEERPSTIAARLRGEVG